MENLEMLVRGLAVQSSSSSSPGLGLPRSGSFQGLELLWVLAVATIVFAVVSVTRVNVVTWGWSKSGSGGHLRVRVQSFTSLPDGAIVTAGGVFSAEIVNCSADSCSEDASSSSDCVSEHAEMLFIFDEKGASLMTTTTTTTTLPSQQHPAPRIAALDKRITLELPEVQKSQQQQEAAPVVRTAQPSLPRREGIEWDAAFASTGAVSWLSPVWAEYGALQLLRPVAKINSSTTDWDPLLRLRIRDAVLSNGSCSSTVILPSAPVSIPGSSTAVTLKDNVVRVWDSDSKALMKSVHLSLDGCGAPPVTAFDVDWESEVAVTAREGGLLSIANLEAGVYPKCYQTQQQQQPLVQAIHLANTSSLSKTVFFTGGPAAANPGCSVSVWDYRASNQQLSMNLSTAVTIHGIRTHGQELFVRDGVSTVAVHDVRKLGASPVSRLPCDVVSHASQDRWWDIDSTFVEAEEDEDDDFFDCLTSQETPSSYVGSSIVRAMSRNFATKTPSHH